MKAMALAVVMVTCAAWAEPPKDAPVRVVILKGDPAPADGCYLNNAACIDTGKELASLRAERDSLRKSIQDEQSPLVYAGAGAVLGLVLGVLVGPPIFKLIRKQP